MSGLTELQHIEAVIWQDWLTTEQIEFLAKEVLAAGYRAAPVSPSREVEALAIDTCPYWKRVLLWMPEMPGFAQTWWIGQRCGGDSRNHGYDEQWKLATPFSQMNQSTGINQQVWMGDAPKPLAWAALPQNQDALRE